MCHKQFLALLLGLAASACSTVADQSVTERSLALEVRNDIRDHGGNLWAGWPTDPRAVLLVLPMGETLFCAPATAGFEPILRTPAPGCIEQQRGETLPPDIAAPVAVGGNTVAASIGTTAALETEPAYWRLTLAHELFHAFLQNDTARREKVSRVEGRLFDALVASGISPLDYPFPYAKTSSKQAFSAMSDAALTFLAAETDLEKRRAADRYITARSKASQRFEPEDWEYYEYQASEEGVARWTEIRFGELAGEAEPELAHAAADARAGLATSLRSIEQTGLETWKRNAFYVFGAIEAEILDRFSSNWRITYRSEPLMLGAMLDDMQPSLRESVD